MNKSFRETVCALGAEYVGEVKAESGAIGAAALAKILQDRLESHKGKKPRRIKNAHDHYRLRTIPMTTATLNNLDALVKWINRMSARKVSKNHVAALLLEKAIVEELARSG